MGGASTGKSGTANATLNVVPTIDLLICIICFLVISASWVSLSRLDVDQVLPKRSDQTRTSQTPPKPPTIQIAITPDGHLLNMIRDKETSHPAPSQVASLGSFPLCRGRTLADGSCTGEVERFTRYDTALLEERLVALMREAGEGEHIRVLVAADDGVSFLSLVGTLDSVIRTCSDEARKHCLSNPAIGDFGLLRGRGFAGRI